MATATSTASVASRKGHRGLFLFLAAALLLLALSRSPCAHGQEAAVAEEAHLDLDAPVLDHDAPVDGDAACDGDADPRAAATADETAAVPGVDSEVTGGANDADATAAAAPAEEAGDGEEIVASDDADAHPAEADAAAPAVGGSEAGEETPAESAPLAHAGPFADLLGDRLLSLEMVDETHAQVRQHNTNEALAGKKVVGLYFSADWCGPCKQFTPELVDFYNKMNARRGKQNDFEIVWVSRCRTVDAFGQYFTHMNWLALPPDVATGPLGQALGEKYRVQGIPSLVLLDEIGQVITRDGRNKIPLDRAGIGFPWRSPLSLLVSALVPRSLRLMIQSQLAEVVRLVKGVLLRKK